MNEKWNIWNMASHSFVRECLLGVGAWLLRWRRVSPPLWRVACFAWAASAPIAKSFAWWGPFKFYAHKINSPCASAEKWHIVGGVIEERLFFSGSSSRVRVDFSASFTRPFIVLVKVKLINWLFAASRCVNEIQHTRAAQSTQVITSASESALVRVIHACSTAAHGRHYTIM